MAGFTRSIQGRVLALVFASAGVLWAVVAGFTWVETRHELDELLDAHLAQAAALLVAQQLPEVEEGHGIDAPVLHRYAPRVAFQVFHEGRLALRSVNAPEAPIAEPGSVAANEFTTVRIDGEPWRVFATRGAKSDVLVLVAENARARGSILFAILRTTLGPLLVGLPLLALALWWSVRRGLAPVQAIGRSLAAREADDFSPVARAGAPVELQPMLDALDSLFARTAKLLSSERRFTADAAHELRTPLAAIRAQAQVAIAEDDPAMRRHALESTIAGCDRASRLVDQLLALSRIDAQAAPARQPVDLTALVRDVLVQAAGAAAAKRQALRFDAPAQACGIFGDATLLAALVRNLADNAVRHAPEGAAIRVALHEAPGSVVLEVADSGPAPADADMHRLGERFYRVPGTEATGSGLGLSIVRRVAELHGAQLAFSRSRELGGLEVSVSFTAAPSGAAAAPS